MDYTKDHKNRVNSLLMEKWGYGKNKMEEGPEDEPHVYDVVDAGGDYGDAYPGQSVTRPESTPKAKAEKPISRSSNDNPHNRGDERDREGTNLYPEGQELEEMQGHPGKCCDMAHPDEEHDSYVDRISIRIAEELRTISITEELPAEEEPAEEAPEASDKMSAGDFKTKSMDQAKMGSESGMDPKENAIISQLVDILKVAAKEGNITTGSINTLLNKAAAEAKKIS